MTIDPTDSRGDLARLLARRPRSSFIEATLRGFATGRDRLRYDAKDWTLRSTPVPNMVRGYMVGFWLFHFIADPLDIEWLKAWCNALWGVLFLAWAWQLGMRFEAANRSEGASWMTWSARAARQASPQVRAST